MSRLQEVFLFQPTSVAGCQLWLDARDVNGTGLQPGNGAAISTWTDKSGSGRNATQATSGLRPTYSNNTMVFAGANYFDMADAFNMLSPVGKFYSIFVVEKRGSLKTTQNFMVAFGGAAGNLGIAFGYNNDTTFSHTAAYIADTLYTVPTYQNPDPIRTWSGGYNGAIRDLILNGTTVTTTNPYTYAITAWTQPCIGYLPLVGINQYYVGSIYEILFYNSYLPTGQRQQIEGYLAWKWGTQGSLPSNHPFKTYRPLAQTPFPLTIPPMPLTTTNLAVFLPTQISGCSIWLDGADPNGNGILPSNGASVSTWVDKSGSGLNATSIDTAPVYQINNGYPSITFNNSYMTTGTVPAGKLDTVGITYIAVATLTNFTQQQLIFGSASPEKILRYDTVNSIYTINNSVLRGTFNNTNGIRLFVDTAASINVFVNGTNTYSSSSAVTYQPQTTSTSYLLGKWNGFYFTGYVNEVLAYANALTTSQRQQVEGYLAWKWGLQANLPIGHPYKQAPVAPFPFRALPLRGSLNVWQPTQVSGCSLWLDAADASTLTLSGSTVTQWRDKSGNAANATGSGTPALTQSIQNRLPAIYFNGSSYFTGALTNTTNKHSFFSVFRYDTGAPQYARLASFGVNGQFDYNNNAYYNLSYNTGTLAITRSPTETQVTLASPALDAFHQASILFTGASGLYYTDGGTNINSAAWSANFNYNQYRLGSDQIPFVPQEMIGYIAEVIVYNTIAVTNAERQQIEGYLAWKWGLVASLPSNHPFKRWPPSP